MNNTSKIEGVGMGRFNGVRNKHLNSFTALNAGRFASAGLTGGIGYAASKEVNRRAEGFLRKKADKVAESYKKNKDSTSEHKLSGVGFWMIFGLTIINEILGIILSFTIILPVIIGLITSFIVFFYLAYSGVSFSTRKMVVWIVAIVIEMVPILNMLPSLSVSLFLTRLLENNETLKKVAGAKSGDL